METYASNISSMTESNGTDKADLDDAELISSDDTVAPSTYAPSTSADSEVQRPESAGSSTSVESLEDDMDKRARAWQRQRIQEQRMREFRRRPAKQLFGLHQYPKRDL
ncbi:uncharacterized protein LAJ45_11508 [Morchella importuna]|uniref:uncharacterized protein n=1 Tax=Morchella importuna TaxID=1174673 RepID=UPI001E8E700F|nr:uncharacterized protein LAJ45_11508 [Morchella importuna]KAH8144497.1 hypothetical protein LAJ45_11508 [Morchella importuna]